MNPMHEIGNARQNLLDIWDNLLFPVLSFFLRPFADAYKVATDHPKVLPAQQAIGFMAWSAISAWAGIALSSYFKMWGYFTTFVAIYVVVFIARTYIWTIIDLRKDLDEYFGDDGS